MEPSAITSHAIPQIQWGVVLGASLVAAGWDVRTRRIPNWLCGPLFLAGLVHAVAVAGFPGLGDALIGCLILGVPYVALFVFAGGGAGDAKFMGAIGTWLGLSASLPVLAAVAICGGVLGLGYALVRRRLGGVLGNLRVMTLGAGLWAVNRARLTDAQAILPSQDKMVTMPYGVAILTGVAAVLAGRALWHI